MNGLRLNEPPMKPALHLQEGMTAPLRKLWLRRAPQERRLLVYGALLLCVLLYIWLMQAAGTARGTLQQRVAGLRNAAVLMEQQATELEQLRMASPPAVSDAALLPLLQESAAQAGLAELLLQGEALGADEAALTFGAIPFATWLRWIDALRMQNIHVVSARIETLSTPGLVSVSATLARPTR
jgi:general secretion pathway protein M